MLVTICVQSICIILLLQHKYSAPLQHWRNWCQPPLTTARRLSIANGDAPVLTPMVALLLRRLLTSFPPSHPCPTNVPSSPSIPSSQYQSSQGIKSSFSYLTQYRYQYDLSDTTKSIRFSRYNPSSVSSEGDPPTIPSLIRKTHPQLPQMLIFHHPQRTLPPDTCSLPLLLNLLLTSLIHI